MSAISAEQALVRARTILVLISAAALLLPAPAIAQSGDPESGRQVFEGNCAMCHGRDASGMMGMHPSLRGAVERLSREGVEVTVRKGRDTMPPMPSFEDRLSEEEIDDVVTYLDTLPVGPRNFAGEGDMMDMDGMMGGRMGAWLLWAVVSLVVVAAVGVGAIFLARSFGRRGTSTPGAEGSGALDILKQRYARGEIDRDEYDERRRALQDE